MPRFAANLSMMYTEVDFLDRFGAAATDGFGAVEYLFPYAFDRVELAARLHDHGLVHRHDHALAGVAQLLEAVGRGLLDDVEDRLRPSACAACTAPARSGCPAGAPSAQPDRPSRAQMHRGEALHHGQVVAPLA